MQIQMKEYERALSSNIHEFVNMDGEEEPKKVAKDYLKKSSAAVESILAEQKAVAELKEAVRRDILQAESEMSRMERIKQANSKFFAKVVRSWTVIKKKLGVMGYFEETEELVEIKQQSAAICFEVTLKGDDEKVVWLTDSALDGLQHAYWIKEAGELGDVHQPNPEKPRKLSPMLKLLKRAALAKVDGDVYTYNYIVMLLAIRGDNNNYMFRYLDLVPKLHKDSIVYYLHRFGEDQRFSNLTKGMERALMDALYPKLDADSLDEDLKFIEAGSDRRTTKATNKWVPFTNFAFAAEDKRNKDGDVDYDGMDNNHTDRKQISLVERARRQNEEGKDFQSEFQRKQRADKIQRTVDEGDIEILNAFSLPLLSMNGEKLKGNPYLENGFMTGLEELMEYKGFIYYCKETSAVRIRPAAIMGGEALVFPKETWRAMQAFRSEAGQEDTEDEFLTHEDGDEKFAGDIVAASIADELADDVAGKIAIFKNATKSMKIDELHKTLRNAGFDFIEGKTRKTIFKNLEANLIG